MGMVSRHALLVGLVLAACGRPGVSADASQAAEAQTPPPVVHTRQVISQPYHIDKKYSSMRGPYGFDHVYLTEGDPELLWITGYRTTVVDAETGEPLSQEFMCHANLDFDTSSYYQDFPTAPPVSGRVFTLSQGQQDIAFPTGFGIPIVSDLSLSLVTQVLNLNLPEADLSVKHQVEIQFVRDVELTAPMKPLFQAAVEGFKALEDARHYGVNKVEADPDLHGEGCDVGQAAIAGDFDEDGLGQKFSAHWVVKPGREVNRTNVTRFLGLTYDTTVHYIAVHLHPFAESLELIDLTDGKTVYKALADNSPGRIGIDRIDYFTSPEGIVLKKDHEYQLVSVYNNTSDEDADSMAVMYLYALDKRFAKPDFATRVARERSSEPGKDPGPSMGM